MIHRQNWLDIKGFLAYQRDVKQLSPKTLTRNKGSFRHLLEWAGSVPFPEVVPLRPVFPVHLEGVEAMRNYKPTGHALAYKTRVKCCSLARQFLKWAMLEHPDRYGVLPATWLDSLRPRRKHRTPREPEHYTLEEVLALVSLPAETLRLRREIAAVAFLFLSGARVGAFVTLPIKAIDVKDRSVRQWPELGVETKNGKAATTHLLAVPQLLDVVREWDAYVRRELPGNGLWYPRLNRDGQEIDREGSLGTSSRSSRQRMEVALRDLCELAGMPYRSPHKLRHGHAIYASAQAETIAEYKAVSQNLMHANLGTTDGIYNLLNSEQVGDTITELSKRAVADASGPASTDGVDVAEVAASAARSAIMELLAMGALTIPHGHATLSGGEIVAGSKATVPSGGTNCNAGGQLPEKPS